MFSEIEQLLKAGKFAMAEGAARKAADDYPTHAKAHALLGLALFHQGHFEQAVESFERSAFLDPQSSSARLKLAESLDRLQRYDEAFKAAREGAAIDPNNKQLALLVTGLERLAEPDRTDGWERSVQLDRYQIELTHED